MTPGGRKRSQRAIVVVGNRNGAAGFAVGKGQSGISALKKVCLKDATNLEFTFVTYLTNKILWVRNLGRVLLRFCNSSVCFW